jgi:hypothetical protein
MIFSPATEKSLVQEEIAIEIEEVPEGADESSVSSLATRNGVTLLSVPPGVPRVTLELVRELQKKLGIYIFDSRIVRAGVSKGCKLKQGTCCHQALTPLRCCISADAG